MLCSCGGWTVEHEIVRDYERVISYERCKFCGRVEWTQQGKNELLAACKQRKIDTLGKSRDELLKRLNQ